MKIIIASSQFPPTKSGYARHAFELAKGFAEAGHEVKFITENEGCSRVGRVSYLTKEGKSIIDKGCDILQVIGPSPLFSEQCVDYASKRGLKVVYAVCALPGLSSYYYNAAAPALDWAYERFHLKRILKKIDLAIFNTEDYAASCTFYQGPYSVITHGVSSCASPLCNSVNGDGRENELQREGILFVGQLRRYKGIQYLLRALKKVREIGIETKLTIVGDGPDSSRLRKLAKELGIEDHVSFLGNVGEDKLHELYARSRVLVLPSIGAESFGLVLLEARAHGMQLIASNLPGVREITWELGGIPVLPKDSDALSRAIIRALASPQISTGAHSGNNISFRLSERFSWKRIALTYLNTYHSLLQKGDRISPLPLPLNEKVLQQVPTVGGIS